MLVAGGAVLVVSILIERATTIRSAQLVNAAGGNWEARDERYAWQGGPPKWLSLVALLSYAGVLVGLLLIVLALV